MVLLIYIGSWQILALTTQLLNYKDCLVSLNYIEEWFRKKNKVEHLAARRRHRVQTVSFNKSLNVIQQIGSRLPHQSGQSAGQDRCTVKMATLYTLEPLR
jgi:hypothetical protein